MDKHRKACCETEIILEKGERLDDLQANGLKLIQRPDSFCFGCDAVELANFVTGGAGKTVCDLGAGNGIVSVLLAGKKGMRVTAVELQSDAARLAEKNAALNGLKDNIRVLNTAVQDIRNVLGKGSFDIVVTNPPYDRLEAGEAPPSDSIAIARREIKVTLKEMIDAAAYLLKFGGRFYMVCKIQRMAEALDYMRNALIEPKVLQILTPNGTKPPHLFLVSGIKNGAPGLNVLKERVVDAFNV